MHNFLDRVVAATFTFHNIHFEQLIPLSRVLFLTLLQLNVELSSPDDSGTRVLFPGSVWSAAGK